jgi:hypothetical protein
MNDFSARTGELGASTSDIIAAELGVPAMAREKSAPGAGWVGSVFVSFLQGGSFSGEADDHCTLVRDVFIQQTETGARRRARQGDKLIKPRWCSGATMKEKSGLELCVV